MAIVDMTELTLGEAVGLLTQHLIDKTDYDVSLHRRILAALPSECRFYDNITGKLQARSIIDAVLQGDYNRD